MRHLPRQVAGALAAAFLGVSAVAAPPAVTVLGWDDEQRFERTLTVEPGGFAELCGRLTAGARVEWRFEALRPVDFNIHFHVGKDVRYPVKRNRTSADSGVLDADRDEDYCWMWSEKSASGTSVRVALRRTR